MAEKGEGEERRWMGELVVGGVRARNEDERFPFPFRLVRNHQHRSFLYISRRSKSGTMSSSSRAPEISLAGYLLYLHRHPSLPRPSLPHPPTSTEILLLSLLVAGILTSPSEPQQQQQQQRGRGDPRTRDTMLKMIGDLDRGMDRYEDKELQVRFVHLLSLLFRFYHLKSD